MDSVAVRDPQPADSIKRFNVDDYPITDDRFGADTNQNGREIKSGTIRSLDMVWYSNSEVKQTLVFELYTDNFRNATYQFLDNDIPPGLIARMGIVGEDGDTIDNRQKQKYFRGFLKHTNRINKRYFTTNKGFRLGDPKARATSVYGRPDSTSPEGGVETCEWDFYGDQYYDPKADLKGKPPAGDSSGHQVVMFFRRDRLIGWILHNGIP